MKADRTSAKGRGLQTRGVLQKAYNIRGNARSWLFSTYSAKLARPIVIPRLWEYVHFLACEGDGAIRRVDYSGVQEKKPTEWGAVEVVSRGVLQIRVVVQKDPGLEKEAGLRALVARRIARMEGREDYTLVKGIFVTEQDLRHQEILIRNWHRLIPWIAQARTHPLGTYQNLIGIRLRNEGSLSARMIFEMGEDDLQVSALYMAAALNGVATGLWHANLQNDPFCGRTNFELMGRVWPESSLGTPIRTDLSHKD